MGQYGGMSPKRHHGFSNNKYASFLDLGVYRRAEQAKKKLQTVKRYQKKDGKQGYVGTKNLKQTQSGSQLNALQLNVLHLHQKPLQNNTCQSVCSCQMQTLRPIPSLPLRVYPRAFAERIRVLFDRLKFHGEGRPPLVAQDYGAGPRLFEGYPWSDWEEAGLMGPLRYARGNRHLDCPAAWKAVFPHPFEYLAKKDRGTH